MAPAILSLRDVSLTFGGTPLLEGAELSVVAGDRLALVGRNGSGKSTLLKLAAGFIEPDRCERFLQPGTTVRYLPQEPDLTGFATTRAHVEAALEASGALHRAQHYLDLFDLSGEEDPAQLSGGEARRCALAGALAPDPDVLLLDEPTNHLDLPAIERLEATLSATRGALVLISHDRRFLQNLSRATLWLDRGRVRRLDQGFGAFEAWRDEILQREETERHKLDRKIVVETDWLRKGVTARRRRNQGRLRALHALRAQRRAQRRAAGSVAMAPTEGAQSGTLVIEAKGVAKAFGDRRLVRDLSLRVMRGDCIGIVGPNGAGKTTLLNLLTGALAPDAGTVRRGANLQMATLDQRRESLDPATTLTEALVGGPGDTVFAGGKPRHVIGYMKDFLFLPEQARTPIGALSGGERGRLMLARALARPANLLVLDEPTNDLDHETLDLLQELLADYAGTVLLVSHDRDFLDRVVTATIAFEGEGRWVEYAGGYSDMLAQRGADLADRPAPECRKPAKSGTAAARGSDKQARRLSFKDKRALERLPARIDALQADIERYRATLSDGGLYGRDADAFAKAAAGLQQAEADLTAAEEEWFALELKREAVEGA